jgi:DNA polymerase I-like protein with 3'-5' exonuclease and polymerase domains
LIISGEDVHALSTKIQFDLDDDGLHQLQTNSPGEYKKKRTASKSWTFQPLYGGEGATKKQQKYAAAFRTAYPGIADAQETWAQQVGTHQRLITEWGLRYYWPRAKFQRDGRLNVKTSVYNYPIQGFATAEIIPIAVVYLWHRIQEYKDFITLVNTVHDSVILEHHPDYADVVREIGKQAFTADVYMYLERVYDIRFDFVPLGVGITIGDHWTEGEEESYNIYHDGTEEQVA